jgi:hypothetical protein
MICARKANQSEKQSGFARAESREENSRAIENIISQNPKKENFQINSVIERIQYLADVFFLFTITQNTNVIVPLEDSIIMPF